MGNTLIGECTTESKQLNLAPHINDNLGYIIKDKDQEGFYLEIFYHDNRFFCDPVNALREGHILFVKVAEDIGSKKNVKIQTIEKSDLKTSTTNNVVDNYYDIYVAGKVYYNL